MKRILIVEDDGAIAAIERDYLMLSDFQVDIAATGPEGLAMGRSGGYDLILLDLMLPGLDGFALCSTLRETLDIPILMVTARQEDIDKIKGLGLGADDYITKPFSPSVLVARIKAHLAQYDRLKQAGGVDRNQLQLGSVLLQKDARRVFVDGAEVALKNKEYALLLFLLSNPDIVFSEETLYERIWVRRHGGQRHRGGPHQPPAREDREGPLPPPVHPDGLGGGVPVQTLRGGKAMSWLLFAVGSAFFAGITAILAKIGIQSVPSHLATALRTGVVLVFAWGMVFLVGSQGDLAQLTGGDLAWLVLSGLATGASWLCYFRALQLGDVNKVTPIDKSSTVLTILLAWLLLGEPLSLPQGLGVVAIGAGTLLMITRKEGAAGQPHDRRWLLYALGSAVFASLTALFGKLGVANIESNLATAIRTIVVLAMAWGMVFLTGEQKALPQVDRRSGTFLVLSGLATGASWLCYFRALQAGPASVVVPIDKLSILVTILFSSLVLKETLSRKAALGLVLILAGTGAMLL